MPPRAKIRTILPEEVRRELDRRLIDGGFGGYAGLAEWLEGQGFAIGRSSVQRYGAELGRRIEAIRLASESAEALVEASDDAGAMADASLRLIQEKIFSVLIAAEEKDVKALSSAANALAQTARAGVTVRAERRRAIAEAREGIEAALQSQKTPTSPETIQAIRGALEAAAE